MVSWREWASMLYEFLLKDQEEILALTEEKSLQLAGVRQSSVQLKQGLPIFYEQLVSVRSRSSTVGSTFKITLPKKTSPSVIVLT